MKRFIKLLFFALFIFSVVAFSGVAYYDNNLAETYCVANGESLNLNDPFLNCTASQNALAVGKNKQTAVSGDRVTVKLFNLIPVKTVNVTTVDDSEVVVLGTPFGLKMFTEGVLVVGFSDVETQNGTVNPSTEAGIKKGDIILKLNGSSVNTNFDVQTIVKNNKSAPIDVLIKRDSETFTVCVTPKLSKNDNSYKIGLWIRDSSAGIGTLTFYDPKTNVLAGLGHGICDTDTGELLPVESGQFVDAEIVGVKKANQKTTGELQGVFSGGQLAEIAENDITGVYGTDCEKGMDGKILPIALKQEITLSKAQILTTLDGGEPKYYNCVIKKVYHNDSSKIKNMIIQVTDKELIEKTGGIVQGMSGSPIIQNGKLIGAVTHVFVNDCTKGYGIFIENMLETAQATAEAQELKKAS